jgi:hypothetical protein
MPYLQYKQGTPTVVSTSVRNATPGAKTIEPAQTAVVSKGANPIYKQGVPAVTGKAVH